jgi:hypothetical protein
MRLKLADQSATGILGSLIARLVLETSSKDWRSCFTRYVT